MKYGANPAFVLRMEPLRVSTLSGFNRGYRPHNPAKHAQLVALAQSGKTHREIAAIYGGTKHGVRANLRRLRERGVL